MAPQPKLLAPPLPATSPEGDEVEAGAPEIGSEKQKDSSSPNLSDLNVEELEELGGILAHLIEKKRQEEEIDLLNPDEELEESDITQEDE